MKKYIEPEIELIKYSLTNVLDQSEEIKVPDIGSDDDLDGSMDW